MSTPSAKFRSKLKSVYFNKSENSIKHDGNITVPFSISANFTNEETEKDGRKNIVGITFPDHSDTIKDSYIPGEESGGVTLKIYKDSMTYNLSFLLSTKHTGTSTIAFGDNVQEEPYEWVIMIIKEFEGQTDGKTITGSWTAPACKYSNAKDCMISWPFIPYIFGGEECDSTWTWNLKRIK